MIIGSELGTSDEHTSGPAIERSGDLVAMLSASLAGDVLFLDEIHRIARPAEELLYVAMEDFRVDVVSARGPARPPSRWRSAFTLVGATTRAGLLTGPLRDRFGFTGTWSSTTPATCSGYCTAAPGCSGSSHRRRVGGGRRPLSAARPASPTGLLRRVRDFAEVKADGRVTLEVARAALALYDVDELGLDRLDRSVLDALVSKFGGGPVGVTTLAVAVGEEPETVEEVAEPFLVRAGLLARTPRGRVATPAAWAHLDVVIRRAQVAHRRSSTVDRR